MSSSTILKYGSQDGLKDGQAGGKSGQMDGLLVELAQGCLDTVPISGACVQVAWIADIVVCKAILLQNGLDCDVQETGADEPHGQKTER